MHREVAIKILPDEVSSDPSSLQSGATKRGTALGALGSIHCPSHRSYSMRWSLLASAGAQPAPPRLSLIPTRLPVTDVESKAKLLDSDRNGQRDCPRVHNGAIWISALGLTACAG